MDTNMSQQLHRRLEAYAMLKPSMDARTRQLWQINKYLWMSLAFVLIYLPIAQQQHLLRVPVWAAWVLFGLALADGGGRTYLAYRRGGNLTDSWAWFFTYLDIALISASIGVTGGIESDLWLLYFVVMTFESLFATPQAKHRIDVTIIAAYLLAALPYQLVSPPPAIPTLVFVRIMASRLFFLVVVGALGRRISANAAARNQELLLLREQMATGEERARIAREIHDGLGHALVSSILRLELCARLIPKAPEEAQTILKEEIPALRAAWNEGRDLAFHLRPWEMDAAREDGLVDTLRRHIGRFAERTGLAVDLKVEGEDWRLRPEAAFGLMRIVQEALTNAAKHALPSVIEITLARAPRGSLTCVIRDDGKGFDVGAQHIGVGLLAMRERAEALGGELAITSALDAGTTITVTLPE